MSFEVPDLPYSYSALEPYIDEETMRFHHDKHHAAYVNMLNGAVEAAKKLGGKSVEELITDLDSVPEAQRGAVRNHGGGHFNHSMFWEIMGPASGERSSELNTALLDAFGNLDDQSFILAPQLNWDAFEDVTLGAWVSQPFGENDSEFGIQDLALRFRLRAYFQ
jgi:superoxide dismutase